MKIIIALCLLPLNYASFAALPPEYQNEKDLKVLVGFVKEHSQVISTLHTIDFKTKTVYFGNNCYAEFIRKKQRKPKGWVGPAAPLVFAKSNCLTLKPQQ